MKKVIIILAMALVVLAAVGLLGKRKADLAKAPMAQVLPVVVDAVVLKRQDFSLTLPAMGLVSSDLSTTLSTRLSGQVLQVMKQEGESVKKGDILATIEAAELTAKKQGLLSRQVGLNFQIAAAQENVKALGTTLANAQESHARTLELLKVKGASIEEARREESEIAGAQAKLSAAENTISSLHQEQKSIDQSIKEIEALSRYATITAPISGTVSQRHVQPGDMALPGKPLFRIAAETGLFVTLSLPDSISAKEIILQGKRLPLTAKNEASAAGLAQYVAPLASGFGFVEGQYVNVRVVVQEGEGILVPVDALLTVGGESFVFIHAEGRAVKTRVEITGRGSEGVTIAQDLADKKVLLAKPDLLLRASAGVPVLLKDEGERDNG